MLASRQGQEKMELGDIIFSRVLIGLVLIEFFADQQQWGRFVLHLHTRTRDFFFNVKLFSLTGQGPKKTSFPVE
jgi:hypothetical protein